MDPKIRKILDLEKEKANEENIIEGIVYVSWFYNIGIDEVFEMPMPRFRILLHYINKIQKNNAIIQANQIGKLFGGKKGKSFR